MTLLERLTAHLKWKPLPFPGVYMRFARVAAGEAQGILWSAGLNGRIPNPGYERVLGKDMYLVNVDGKIEFRQVLS